MGSECKMLEDAGVDRIQFDVMDGNVRPARYTATARHTLGWSRSGNRQAHGLDRV